MTINWFIVLCLVLTPVSWFISRRYGMPMSLALIILVAAIQFAQPLPRTRLGLPRDNPAPGPSEQSDLHPISYPPVGAWSPQSNGPIEENGTRYHCEYAIGPAIGIGGYGWRCMWQNPDGSIGRPPEHPGKSMLDALP